MGIVNRKGTAIYGGRSFERWFYGRIGHGTKPERAAGGDGAERGGWRRIREAVLEEKEEEETEEKEEGEEG
jgi:hypothetical protein